MTQITPEQLRKADCYFAAFDRLYGITHGKDKLGFIRFNTRIREGFQRRGLTGRKWSTQPGKKHPTPPDVIIGRIKKDIAKTDSRFAWGINLSHCERACAAQMEYDFPAGVDVNEDLLRSITNQECLTFLQDKGIEPHFILTGGRSIHCAFYFQELPADTLRRFTRIFHARLLTRGEPCSHSFKRGMRLPLSIHQSTGGLCRYVGTDNPESVVAYAESISPCLLNYTELLDVCNEWLTMHPEVIVNNVAPVFSKDDPRQTKTHKDIVSSFGDEDNPLVATSIALNHQQRELYEEYMAHGVPDGRTYDLLVESDFVFWALHKLNSKQRVWDQLSRRLMCEDRALYQDRLERLAWKLGEIDYRPTIPKRDKGDVPLTEEETAWLNDLEVNMRFCRSKRDRLIPLARYILQKLRNHGGEAPIGVEEIARITMRVHGSSKPINSQASGDLLVFRSGRYKILEQTGDYRKSRQGKPGIKRRFRRVKCLPILVAMSEERAA